MPVGRLLQFTKRRTNFRHRAFRANLPFGTFVLSSSGWGRFARAVVWTVVGSGSGRSSPRAGRLATARFDRHRAVLQLTSDPEAVAALRELIERGATV